MTPIYFLKIQARVKGGGVKEEEKRNETIKRREEKRKETIKREEKEKPKKEQ